MSKQKKTRKPPLVKEVNQLEIECKQLPLVVLEKWQNEMTQSQLFQQSEIVPVIIKWVKYLTLQIQPNEKETDDDANEFFKATWKNGSDRIKSFFPKFNWDCLTLEEDEMEFQLLMEERKSEEATASGSENTSLRVSPDTNTSGQEPDAPSGESTANRKSTIVNESLLKFHLLLKLVASSNFQYTLFRKALNATFQRPDIFLKSPYSFVKPKNYYPGEISKNDKMRSQSLERLQDFILPLSMAGEIIDEFWEEQTQIGENEH